MRQKNLSAKALFWLYLPTRLQKTGWFVFITHFKHEIGFNASGLIFSRQNFLPMIKQFTPFDSRPTKMPFNMLHP